MVNVQRSSSESGGPDFVLGTDGATAGTRPDATPQSGRAQFQQMPPAPGGRSQPTSTNQVRGDVAVAQLKSLGYSDQQIDSVRAGSAEALFESLSNTHKILSIAFEKRELPILRRQLTEVASGDDGRDALNDIAADWKTLRGCHYANQQLKEVFMYHGLPGLRSLYAANRAITGDVLQEKMSSVRERLVAIGADQNGVQRLRASAQHWSALRKRSSVEEILTLASVPNGASVLSVWANAIEDGTDARA